MRNSNVNPKGRGGEGEGEGGALSRYAPAACGGGNMGTGGYS